MTPWALIKRNGFYWWRDVPRAINADGYLGPFTTRKQALKFAPLCTWSDETGDDADRLAG